MNENLYGMFDKVLESEFSIIDNGSKKVIELGKEAEYGRMETYSLFDGIIIAFMDINIENVDNVFFEDKLSSRLLQINHCAKGRYSYAVCDDNIVYFGEGDLCVSIYDLTKSFSDFPLGFYEGLEIFIDVDVANKQIKGLIPDFDLIDMIIRDNGEYILISIKYSGECINVMEDEDMASNIAILNKISEKIDYSQILGLNNIVIRIK